MRITILVGTMTGTAQLCAQEHMARVLAQGDTRPFKGRSAALEEIRKLLADRERLYGRAGSVVDTSGKSMRQALAELKKAVA